MARDKNLKEVFETVLYHNGVKDSGRISQELYEEYVDWVENVFPKLAIQKLDEMEDDRH